MHRDLIEVGSKMRPKQAVFILFRPRNSKCVSVIQSCLTLCDPMDCSPPGRPYPWDSPGKNTGVGCHFLLQGILPRETINEGGIDRTKKLSFGCSISEESKLCGLGVYMKAITRHVYQASQP